jgi:hypothetical protein
MKKASTGAQGSAGSLQSMGTQNQDFANTQRNAQFGANGTLTGFMNPNSLNVTNPTGAYATQYQNAANSINQGANQSVASANRQMANQGGGLQPSGFGSAQTQNAYQNAANAKASAFQGATTNQQNNATSNFWNAQNAYGQTGNQASSQAGSNMAAAGGLDTSLYGNASQQKQNGWAVAGNTLANMGQSASGMKNAGLFSW